MPLPPLVIAWAASSLLACCQTESSTADSTPPSTETTPTTDTAPTTETTGPLPTPLDVLIAVDGSADMADEAKIVEARLNSLFQALDEAGRQPRFTLLATFGSEGAGICVPPPLGRFNCDLAPETEAFVHLDTPIQSFDLWCQLLDALPRLA